MLYVFRNWEKSYPDMGLELTIHVSPAVIEYITYPPPRPPPKKFFLNKKNERHSMELFAGLSNIAVFAFLKG